MPYNITYIEIIGVAFGFACVLLTAKQNIWCWPTGIVSILAYIVFYYQKTLYLNVILHFFFLGASIIGWYQWLYGGTGKTRLQVSKASRKQFRNLALLMVITFLLLGILSDRLSDSEMPYLDALVTSMSFTAQWMMNQKLMECWLLWVVTDLIYAIMFFNMQNYLSFLLYAVYVITATAAYFAWKRSFLKTQTIP